MAEYGGRTKIHNINIPLRPLITLHKLTTADVRKPAMQFHQGGAMAAISQSCLEANLENSKVSLTGCEMAAISQYLQIEVL